MPHYLVHLGMRDVVVKGDSVVVDKGEITIEDDSNNVVAYYNGIEGYSIIRNVDGQGDWGAIS